MSCDWVDPEGVDHSNTISLLKKMVAAAWHCKDNMEKEKYTHPSFHVKWIENPFRQRTKDQDKQYHDRNRSNLIHAGKIQCLSVEEVRNFTLAIDRFFAKLSVLNWFALLDKWEVYSKEEETIITGLWDEHPLCTYEELTRLIEIAFLGDNFYYYNLYDDGLLHNLHFFEDDYVITKLDAVNTDCYNPLEQINWIFGDYTASELKEFVDYWFDCANDATKIWDRDEPGKLVDFHDRVICLYEAGWLLTQGDEIPNDWLHPNCFKSFESPKINTTAETSTNFLSDKKLRNPRKTLSKLYCRTGVGLLKYHLAEVLSFALQKRNCSYKDYGEDRIKIKQIIEILDVINKETCARHK